MEIEPNSRYRDTPLVNVLHPSGDRVRLRELRRIPRRTSVFSVVPVDGDRLDLLSSRYYRDPLLFWRIADASDHLDPFDVVSTGEILHIPPDKDT